MDEPYIFIPCPHSFSSISDHGGHSSIANASYVKKSPSKMLRDKSRVSQRSVKNGFSDQGQTENTSRMDKSIGDIICTPGPCHVVPDQSPVSVSDCVPNLAALSTDKDCIISPFHATLILIEAMLDFTIGQAMATIVSDNNNDML